MEKQWELLQNLCLQRSREILNSNTFIKDAETAIMLAKTALDIQHSAGSLLTQFDGVIGDIPTCELIRELEKREAVQSLWVEPNQPFGVTNDGKRVDLEIAEGPAIILVVWD